MFIDFRTADIKAPIEADICIVGTGAAGLSIAKTLIGSSHQVVMLESGTLLYDQPTQMLYDGVTVGYPWATGTSQSGLTTSRLRLFGGTTNHWGGGCIPLAPMDFEKRDWVPYSGWPITRADVDPYYERARPYLHLPNTKLDDPKYAAANNPGYSFDPNKLVFKYGLLTPQPRLGSVFHDEIDKAANVRVLLNANLLEFVPNDTAAAIREARFRTLEGKRGKVHARLFILACGGIENARLLLLSNSVVPTGLGNGRDLVGRFFMDHPRGRLGRITTDRPALISDPYNRFTFGDHGPHPGDIALSPKAQAAYRTINGRMRPQDYEDASRIPDGVEAVREWEAALTERELPPDPVDLTRRVLVDFGDVLDGFYRRLKGEDVVTAHHIDLEGYFEQAPNRNSRVTLTDTPDAIGQRKVKLDWEISELDWHTYRTAVELLAGELGRLDLARVQVEPWLHGDGPADYPLRGAAHHLGTTRMSDDPQTGVVDRNCRVHGIDNLYVAGGSVFATGGYALPTFTIIALAIRLADHVNERLLG